MNKRMTVLEVKMAKIIESVEALTVAMQKRSRSPSRTKACFNCGQEGHWIADCKLASKKEKQVQSVFDPLPDTESDESDRDLNEDGSEH